MAEAFADLRPLLGGLARTAIARSSQMRRALPAHRLTRQRQPPGEDTLDGAWRAAYAALPSIRLKTRAKKPGLF